MDIGIVIKKKLPYQWELVSSTYAGAASSNVKKINT